MSDAPAEILVDVDWLKGHLADPNLRIVDTRASDPRLPVGYRLGHIPGAVALDVGRELFVFGGRAPQLAPVEKIGQVLARLGVSNDTRIVVHDEWTGELAAFTYWALRYAGHRDLRILHGGWAAWQKGNGPVSREAPAVAPAEFRVEPNDAARASAEWIEANAGRGDVVLLDARSEGEYAMGHIPGAVNLPYDYSLDPRTQMFRDTAALRAGLESVGATPDKEIVTYCASGARSSHLFTTLALLGYPRVRNYDGSMTDWYHLGGRPIE